MLRRLNPVEQLLIRMESTSGNAGWMYLDANGAVRVGSGLLLPDAEAARQLPFQLGVRAATQAEIAAEFRRVTALPPRLPASFYHREHGPELEPEMTGALLRTSLVGLQLQLRDWLPHFDRLSVKTQIGLLSAGYSSGAREALSQYLKLIQPSPPAVRREPAMPHLAARHRPASLRELPFGLVGLGAAMLERLHATSHPRKSAHGQDAACR